MREPTAQPARLLVMLSGGGRTMLNLHDAINRGELPAEIALVIASRACAGEERARDRDIPTRVVPGEIPAKELAQIVREYAIDLVVLAGYLRLVHIPPELAGRVVNIHPALLPRHGGRGMHGRHVHEAVLAAGDTETGCTIHLCTPEYDQGPILAQARCPVRPGDTPDTLAARVFELECATYPRAIAGLIATLRAPDCGPRGSEREPNAPREV